MQLDSLVRTMRHNVRGLFVSRFNANHEDKKGVAVAQMRQILGAANVSSLYSVENSEFEYGSVGRTEMVPYSLMTLTEAAWRGGIAVWNQAATSKTSLDTFKICEQHGLEFVAPCSLLCAQDEKIERSEWVLMALGKCLVGREYRFYERSLVPGTIIPDIYTLVGTAASVFHTKGTALFGGRRLFSSSVYRGERVVVSQSHDGRTITLALVSLRHKAPGLGVAVVWQPY